MKRFRNEPGTKTLFIVCLGLIGFRFIFTGIMGLMPQDAYYDFYAQHLDLSYYDHPPAIAYLLRLFTTLFGKKVFAVKLADATVTGLSVIAFFQLAKKFLPVRAALNGTALLISTFMISILSLISTPDVPLMLCWTISLNFLYEAVFNQKKSCWIWAGLFTGLSFDSKYTAVFLIIGLIGFLIFAKPYRKQLFSGWMILYLSIFLITILPVIIWNLRNGFASFKFQSEGRVKEGLVFDISGFGGVIGHQTAILLPILFFSLIYFIYRLFRKYGVRIGRIPSDQLFLLSFFIPLFLGFFAISFIYWVKLNWMMPAYITGIIWVCRYWNRKWIRFQFLISLILHLALAIEIIFYIIPIESDDTWFGWQSLSAQVANRRQEYPDAFIFSADDYKTSSVLNFFLKEMVYSRNIVGEKALQYDFIGTDLQTLKGRNAIYIDSNPRFTDLNTESASVPPRFRPFFEKFIPLDPILVRKNGKVERKFSVYLCLNYHPR